MLIAVLFLIAQRWKQPNCSSTDKWINKSSKSIEQNVAYPYNGIYSALKRNEVLTHVQYG